MARIDDANLVRHEYSDETRLAQRFRAFRDYLDGPSPETTLIEAVRETSPKTILEVGCGDGQLARRLMRETQADVTAIDLAERMVQLARVHGVNAHLGDVQHLAFADDSFDVVVASWMFYHVPDLDQAMREIKRVLTPGGRFIASTFGPETLGEMWELVDDEADNSRPIFNFSPDNGEEILRREFDTVSYIDVTGTIVFPDWEAARAHIASTITRQHLADKLPHFDGELRTASKHRIFIAS